MKILVIADTHGETSTAEKIIRSEKPDHVIHLGDCVRDAEELSDKFPILPICKIPGNNDFFSDEPKEKVILLGGTRIFLCHGHTTGVKNGDYTVQWEKAHRQNCQVSLFGHTHSPHLEERNGVLLLNPGTLKKDSYAILTLRPGDPPRGGTQTRFLIKGETICSTLNFAVPPTSFSEKEAKKRWEKWYGNSAERRF